MGCRCCHRARLQCLDRLGCDPTRGELEVGEAFLDRVVLKSRRVEVATLIQGKHQRLAGVELRTSTHLARFERLEGSLEQLCRSPEFEIVHCLLALG